MQKRAGILFLSKNTGRILLIQEESKWTVPTFIRNTTVLEDCQSVFDDFTEGKILPIELYVSQDKGFEYGTFVCLVNEEFTKTSAKTICWASMNDLPKNIHTGLKTTLNSDITKTKLDTILVLINDTTNTEQ
jgi:hypothetical protein